MAQLTWRNVDAPNFSGVTDALRLAGQSLTAGLSAGRDAIGDFQKVQSQAEGAKLAAAVAAESDPTKLPAIIAGFDPALLTPDAIKTALGRPQEMATLAQTKTATAGQTIANDFNSQNNPLRLESNRIANAQATENLSQDRWKNAKAQEESAAQPAWNQMVAQYRALRANPDPASQAQAATIAASPEFAARAAAAGVKDIAGVLDKGEAAAANAVKLKTSYLELGEKERATNLATTARSLAENYIAETGSPAGALRRIQEDTQAPPELRTAVAKIITDAAPTYRTPSETEVLAGNAAAAAGQPGIIPTAPRERLDFFTSAAKAAGLEVTSGFRGPDHPLTRANPNSAHAQSRAWDLRARTTEEADTVMAKQREIFAKLGMQEGRDYKIIDEVRKPAGHATGPHVHVQFTAEGEARQKTAEAGQNIGAGSRERQVMSNAVEEGARRLAAQAAAAANFQPGVKLETPQDLTANYQTVQTALSSAANTSTIDGGFNPAAPVAAAFTKPPEKPSTAAEVAAQLHKRTGDKEDGGIFGRDKLTVENINQAVQKVVKDYDVTPDIAGALIESSIQTTGGVLLRKGRDVDYGQLQTYIDRFVERTGPNKGKPKTELLNIMSSKAAIEKQVTETKSLLEKAREEWLGAENAARNGNTRVNVQAARERFASVQRAADLVLNRLNRNPSLTGNMAANTGR